MKTKTERVDEIPILLSELEKSNLSDLLNEYFPDHGNWQGTNSGKIIVIFLIYVLSNADHRLSHIEKWVGERIFSLRHLTGLPDLSPKDFTDDKLGSLLDRYSDMERWTEFEFAHNRNLINVFNLNTGNNAIRLDAMITQSHREQSGDFKYGYSKQHRSDLPQLKSMVAVLDPMAMPLYSMTVSGNTADDELYWPSIAAMIKEMPLVNQLFVGDSKMGSKQIRSKIHGSNHYYLTPLNKKQCSVGQLKAYVKQRPSKLIEITKQMKDGEVKIKAKAFEVTEVLSNDSTPWLERRIVVFSPAYADRQKKGLEDRLSKAKSELSLLNQPKQGRKQAKTEEELELMVKKILTKHRVKGLIGVEIIKEQKTKEVRAYLDRPKRVEIQTGFSVKIVKNKKGIEEQIELMGWRAYATNAPQEQLSTRQAVECYRNEYKIEHKFDELLNRITALMPVFVKKENRIKSLICLLLLGLKFVSLIQYQVRNELAKSKQTIKELYPGNPARATDKPTTNLILNAFKNINLVIVAINGKIHVDIQKLKPVQIKILQLLNITTESYYSLNQLVFSHFDFSET